MLGWIVIANRHIYYNHGHGASRRHKSRKPQVESWGGDLVDFQVILVPSQVANASPSDSHGLRLWVNNRYHKPSELTSFYCGCRDYWVTWLPINATFLNQKKCLPTYKNIHNINYYCVCACINIRGIKFNAGTPTSSLLCSVCAAKAGNNKNCRTHMWWLWRQKIDIYGQLILSLTSLVAVKHTVHWTETVKLAMWVYLHNLHNMIKQPWLPWRRPLATVDHHVTRFLGPIGAHNPNGISIGSAVFAQMTTECPYTLQWDAPSPAPQKLALPMGHLDSRLIHGSPGPPESLTQMATRSVQPFLQGSLVWQTDRRIYVRSTAMRPKNTQKARQCTECNFTIFFFVIICVAIEAFPAAGVVTSVVLGTVTSTMRAACTAGIISLQRLTPASYCYINTAALQQAAQQPSDTGLTVPHFCVARCHSMHQPG